MKKSIMGLLLMLLVSFTTSVSFASDGPESTKASGNEIVMSLEQSTDAVMVIPSANAFAENRVVNDCGCNAIIDLNLNVATAEIALKPKDNKIRFVDRYFKVNSNYKDNSLAKETTASNLKNNDSCFYRKANVKD